MIKKHPCKTKQELIYVDRKEIRKCLENGTDLYNTMEYKKDIPRLKLPETQKVQKVKEDRFPIQDDKKRRELYISWKDEEGRNRKKYQIYIRLNQILYSRLI